jgi:hypothetical protein
LRADVNASAADFRRERDNLGNAMGTLLSFQLLDAFLPPVNVNMWSFHSGYENGDDAQIVKPILSDAWCSLSSSTGAIYLLDGLSGFFGQHALEIFVDDLFLAVSWTFLT